MERMYKVKFPKGKTMWANTKEDAERKRRTAPDSWGIPKISRVNMGALLNKKR